MLMEELKGFSTIKGYPQSGSPIQWPMLNVRGVEVVLECTIRHEFKNQKSMMLVSTIAK